jgi:H+/Cl- antiporter ClcA
MWFAVLAAALAAVVIFWRFSERATHGEKKARWMAAAIAFLLSAGALLLLLLSLLFAGLRCDESCDESQGDWQNSVHGWQWDAQWVIALAATAAVVVSLVLTLQRRHRAAPK